MTTATQARDAMTDEMLVCYGISGPRTLGFETARHDAPASAFDSNRGHPRGTQLVCRACFAAWHASPEGHAHSTWLKSRSRTRQHGLPSGSVTSADILRLLVDSQGCAIQGCTVTDLTVDHVVPLIAGGANEVWNLATLCRPHNSGKGTMPMEVYVDRLQREQRGEWWCAHCHTYLASSLFGPYQARLKLSGRRCSACKTAQRKGR